MCYISDEPRSDASSSFPLLTMPFSKSELSLAYDHLIKALKKPHNPGTCAPVLLGCLAIMMDPPEDRASPESELDGNPMDVCMAFLTAPRSSTQLAQLQEYMLCRCENTLSRRSIGGFVRVLHRRARQSFEFSDHDSDGTSSFAVLLKLIITILNDTLLDALEKGGPALYKVDRRLRRSRRPVNDKDFTVNNYWPESPYQLVPHGAEDTIRGLFQWMSTPLSGALAMPIMLFVKHIVKGGHQLVVPYVVTGPSFSNALVTYIMGRQLAWDEYEKHDPPNSDVHAESLDLLALACGLFHQIYESADRKQFMIFVEGDGTGLAIELSYMFNNMLRWASNLREAMEPLSADQTDRLDIVWNQLSGVSSFVYAFFEQARQRPELCHGAIVDRAKSLKTWHENPVGAAFYALRDLYKSQRCAAPECTATYASAGRKFRHCTGCDRTPYCSAACQRRAWRHASLPHKPVCPSLRFVAEHGMLRREVEEADLQPFLNAHLFNTDDQLKAVRAAKVVTAHVEALQTAKMSQAGR